MDESNESIITSYFDFLSGKEFPCVAAKAALSRKQISCYVANSMMCPADDKEIIKFLYEFIDAYRSSDQLYHSAAIIFKDPVSINEDLFEQMLWKRLQALSDLDMLNYKYDSRVSNDPSSKDFSFSLKEEAFFIIGLFAANNRKTRQFKYPAIIFNPHAQFQQLKETNKYNNLKNVVRKRDIALSGSINPMLDDFGNSSEVYQYSGKVYNKNWKCPLSIHHDKHNSAA